LLLSAHITLMMDSEDVKTGELTMENENIDYHLQRATYHLEIALNETKSLSQNEESIRELSARWKQFLVYMFGNFNANLNNLR
jgi:hypothetical protein